ncbi:helix-turn-helix transcriptional regulator [Shimia sagamensis]|uniref:Helix-turn-helix domain-containing protein n=1 Tax=Shimia sagamensis TaxID=1566352 RepID=A0ABY1PJT6_9RHOB|nr:helix-turn-helix domain-containing protein [Shimia sagamensis]SMP34292.1 Helix-turn-helix domain-containing protein [Shimia sagamensis]
MHSQTLSQTTSPNQSASDYLDGFIDETQAADFLCQSVRTIQKWRVTGYGPQFYKSGRSVRYRRRDLLAWGEARCRANTSQNFWA